MSATMAREFPKKNGTASSTSFIVVPPGKRSWGPASALPRCRRSHAFTVEGPGWKRPPEGAAPSGWRWRTACGIRGSQPVEVLSPGRGSIERYNRKPAGCGLCCYRGKLNMDMTGTMLIQAGAQVLPTRVEQLLIQARHLLIRYQPEFPDPSAAGHDRR